jgi:hypothetical protein
MKEWVQKGWFLDLEDIRPENRPDPNYRFFFVKKQRLTELEDLSVAVASLKTATIDLAEIDRKEILNPESKSMIFQCAYGIYPDVKAYMEHPIDYSVGKIPMERPSDKYRVGMISQADSPYDEPDLEKTEFWIIKDLAHKPRIHIYNPHDIDLTAYIKIKINKLVVEPVTDREVINQLERRIKPSTPVYLKVEAE